MKTTDMPITVSASSTNDQVAAAVRAFLIAIGGFMAGKGWIDANIATAAVPVILIAVPAMWAQLSARYIHAQRITLANAVPDSVARVGTGDTVIRSHELGALAAFALAIVAALALSGCTIPGLSFAPSALPQAPVVAANQTVLDEQAALSVELAYKAARTAIEIAVDAGAIKGERARKLADLDNRAYAAVGIVRRAYRAGNATDYATGLSQARLAVSELLALAK